MSLPISELAPARRLELEAKLLEPRRDPKAMTSLERLLRVNLYREMMQGGLIVPEEHLAYGVDLLAADRADRTTAAATARKTAKALAPTEPAGPPKDAADL